MSLGLATDRVLRMSRMFGIARLRLAPTTSSAVSWTVLHCLRTLDMTGMERAKRADWTRIGHTRALIDRVRACVN